jgi:hypothetical protein
MLVAPLGRKGYWTRPQLSCDPRQHQVRHSQRIMFYIGFKTGPRTDEEGWRHAIGGLELGPDSDSFAADLMVWTLADYEAQWRAGVARLATGATTSSALVTSYAGPEAAFHFMWPMWRVGDQIVFAERLVSGEMIGAVDVIDDFYRAVGEVQSHTDDGEAISQWTVPFSDVLAFLTSA